MAAAAPAPTNATGLTTGANVRGTNHPEPDESGGDCMKIGKNNVVMPTKNCPRRRHTGMKSGRLLRFFARSWLGGPARQPHLTVYTDSPFQEPTFLILSALAAGPQHGYGVIAEVQRISDGRVRLRAGTLYAALDRLRADELIEVDHEEVVDTRLRRYYKLTANGRQRLGAEAERLRRHADIATRRLRAAGIPGYGSAGGAA